MSQIVLDTLVVVASVLLAASAIIALYRIVRGPSILDRMIATDVVLASIMCGLGGFMALSGRTDLLPVLIVLAMLGFVGSVSVSRYVSKSDSMTPGAEVGSLSDFSSSDWHMPKESQTETASGTPNEKAEWPDDVARGIADVSDGPDAVTVQEDEENHPVTVGLDQGSDPGADLADGEDAGAEFEPADEGPSMEDPNGADPDVDGEGEGTGPDAGPDDSDGGARTGSEPDDEGSRR